MARHIEDHRLRQLLMLLALLTIPAISGCVAYGAPTPGGAYAGPPPAYADQGSIYYYGNVPLVFDIAWNAWIVRGHPHHYYVGGHYYRWRGGHWDRSRHFRHGWKRTRAGSVPHRLHRHHRKGRGRYSAGPHDGRQRGLAIGRPGAKGTNAGSVASAARPFPDAGATGT